MSAEIGSRIPASVYLNQYPSAILQCHAAASGEAERHRCKHGELSVISRRCKWQSHHAKVN